MWNQHNAHHLLLAAYHKGVKARATLLAVLEENMKFLRARQQRKRCGFLLMHSPAMLTPTWQLCLP